MKLITLLAFLFASTAFGANILQSIHQDSSGGVTVKLKGSDNIPLLPRCSDNGCMKFDKTTGNLILLGDITTTGVITGVLANDSVGAAQIVTDGVGSSEIAADAVGASEIATDAVGALELANDSVASANIIVDTIQAIDIAPNAVGASELNNADTFTMAAINIGNNTLTTYVSGSWSWSTTTSATNVTGGTLTSRVGSYVRVGRMVHASIRFDANPTASPFQFAFDNSNLPATPVATDTVIGMCFRVATSMDDGDKGFVYGDPSASSDIEFNMITTNLGNAGYSCTFTYEATTD